MKHSISLDEFRKVDAEAKARLNNMRGRPLAIWMLVNGISQLRQLGMPESSLRAFTENVTRQCYDKRIAVPTPEQLVSAFAMEIEKE